MRKYSLGFNANGTPLPDPSGFSGETSDLDVSGSATLRGYCTVTELPRKSPYK